MPRSSSSLSWVINWSLIKVLTQWHAMHIVSPSSSATLHHSDSRTRSTTFASATVPTPYPLSLLLPPYSVWVEPPPSPNLYLLSPFIGVFPESTWLQSPQSAASPLHSIILITWSCIYIYIISFNPNTCHCPDHSAAFLIWTPASNRSLWSEPEVQFNCKRRCGTTRATTGVELKLFINIIRLFMEWWGLAADCGECNCKCNQVDSPVKGLRRWRLGGGSTQTVRGSKSVGSVADAGIVLRSPLVLGVQVVEEACWVDAYSYKYKASWSSSSSCKVETSIIWREVQH